ncbi:uncharacterized protein LOC129765950 [Toxorhynchites rutilus septentrionalis]|uniref:uncharacterized protein LOC129765950 n=1 Tax=Toxorhynchites rutilus septentrionalis TaxID=329112 RepID=UPI0024788680|nr:uncharacterized protein LOC129765950 [Toxorhynchites rutilus septentrionalis]
MSDQHQQPPITVPPKRCHEHPVQVAAALLGNLHGSESCKNSPNVPRRLEPHHHNILESGSQSAQNSPLPHRRLDKLQGVIRDKSSPLCGRRGPPEEVDFTDSPIVLRKFTHVQDCACAQKFRPAESSTVPGFVHRIESEFSRNPSSSPMLGMRKRVESDCSCMRKNIIRNQFSASVMKSECGASAADSGASSCENTPLLRRKEPFLPGSPAKGILGEPGVFSSPMHSKSPLDHASFAGFASPAKSVLGEPGVFSSPARSVCSPTAEDGDDCADVLANDQTIVSGWLKFRDNKKWKIRWGVVTKLSPAAASLEAKPVILMVLA